MNISEYVTIEFAMKRVEELGDILYTASPSYRIRTLFSAGFVIVAEPTRRQEELYESTRKLFVYWTKRLKELEIERITMEKEREKERKAFELVDKKLLLELLDYGSTEKAKIVYNKLIKVGKIVLAGKVADKYKLTVESKDDLISAMMLGLHAKYSDKHK